MYLTNQIPLRRVAADAVLGRIGPSHAGPDVAFGIRAETVGEAGRKILSKNVPSTQPAVMDVEDANMGRPVVRDPAIHDIEPRLVRRKCQSIWPHKIIRNDH